MATKGPKLKIAPFNINGNRLDMGRSWSRWLERFEREFEYQGVSIAAKPDIAKAALLIYAGEDVEDVHDSLPTMTKPEGTTDEAWTSYVQTKAKPTKHFLHLLHPYTPNGCIVMTVNRYFV